MQQKDENMGIHRYFCGAAGAAKIFYPLYTRYFGIRSAPKISPLQGGTLKIPRGAPGGAQKRPKGACSCTPSPVLGGRGLHCHEILSVNTRLKVVGDMMFRTFNQFLVDKLISTWIQDTFQNCTRLLNCRLWIIDDRFYLFCFQAYLAIKRQIKNDCKNKKFEG